jgi:hypothetical protein
MGLCAGVAMRFIGPCVGAALGFMGPCVGAALHVIGLCVGMALGFPEATSPLHPHPPSSHALWTGLLLSNSTPPVTGNLPSRLANLPCAGPSTLLLLGWGCWRWSAVCFCCQVSEVTIGTLMVEHAAVSQPGRGVILLFDLTNANLKQGGKEDWVRVLLPTTTYYNTQRPAPSLPPSHPGTRATPRHPHTQCAVRSLHVRTALNMRMPST